MRGRLRGNTGHEVTPLVEGWAFRSCAPDAIANPGALADSASDWTPASVPCTVASALRATGQWSLDSPARLFDAEDWWFRISFEAEPPKADEECWLCLDGLATVADAWLNGTQILSASGMFTAHELNVGTLLRGQNTLAIRFRALDSLLAVKRPRPRWRAPMVSHQQLRWFRTTLLGRTPGWSPPAAAVGPWRPVRLERRRLVHLGGLTLRTSVDGSVDVGVDVSAIGDRPVTEVVLTLARGARTERIALTRTTGDRFTASGRIHDVEVWWPHTHGEPALYDAVLRVRCGGDDVSVPVGGVGFRTIAIDRAEGDFAVNVNGVEVFCRGACWTPLDVVRLDADAGSLDAAFAQLREAGMNMVRVSGTMTYESDEFLDRCDANGVLLWQDLMFANMDYPESDPDFADSAGREVAEQLARLQGRASVAVICGNSEGEQQAAMWGASRDRWSPPLFHDRFAALVERDLPDVAYWPSSAHGGPFPHESSNGTSSYYGVGAYLRPLEDARRAAVRFASECLAFANVPSASDLDRMPGGVAGKVHHPAWKSRTPRDLGAGWDFDDVRDHYLQRCFDVDPVALRYGDHDRYLELGRVVTGEVMAATFVEWRRARSVTRGGLIWFLRDLWPGAGWGVVDSTGEPKAAWHFLRRALSPLAMGITDEGGNGLVVHLMNDRVDAFVGTLAIDLFREGEIRVGNAVTPVQVTGRSVTEVNATTLFEGFHDLSYSYRFGPPAQDIVVATIRDGTGAECACAFHFTGGLPSAREPDVGLTVVARAVDAATLLLTIGTRRFAQAVHVDVEGFQADDNYFHLAPGASRELRLVSTRPTSGPVRGAVRALNSETAVKVMVE